MRKLYLRTARSADNSFFTFPKWDCKHFKQQGNIWSSPASYSLWHYLVRSWEKWAKVCKKILSNLKEMQRLLEVAKYMYAWSPKRPRHIEHKSPSVMSIVFHTQHLLENSREWPMIILILLSLERISAAARGGPCCAVPKPRLCSRSVWLMSGWWKLLPMLGLVFPCAWATGDRGGFIWGWKW
jgi:hypothetical protein